MVKCENVTKETYEVNCQRVVQKCFQRTERIHSIFYSTYSTVKYGISKCDVLEINRRFNRTNKLFLFSINCCKIKLIKSIKVKRKKRK